MRRTTRMIGPYPALRRAARAREQRRGRSPSTTCATSRSGTSSRGWIPIWLVARPAAVGARRRRAAASPKTTSRCCAASSSSCSRCVVPAYRRGQRARAGRAVDLAVLSPDPAAAVRLGRAPARASGRGAAAHAVRAARRCARADRRAPSRSTSRLFGRRPAGMWPSEGSVSDEAVALMAEAGFDVDRDRRGHPVALAGRRAAARRLRPRRAARRAVPAVPRRRRTARSRSSAITRCRIASAFTTSRGMPTRPRPISSSGSARRAGASRHAGGGEDATVAVILDGENAWEHYDGRRPAVPARALRRARTRPPTSQTVTMAEAAAGAGASRCRRSSPAPGSTPTSTSGLATATTTARGRSWPSRARRSTQRAGSVSPEARDRAFEELLIAEGSDWFWWYGDDHSSDHDARLRRPVPAPPAQRLRGARRCRFPTSFFATNITHRRRARPARAVRPPRHRALDGRDTSFLEWVGAVAPALARPAGAMHEVAALAAGRRGPGSVCGLGACACASAGSDLPALMAAGAAPLALVVAGRRSPRRVGRAAWMGVATRSSRSQIPFDRHRRRRRRRSGSSRSRSAIELGRRSWNRLPARPVAGRSRCRSLARAADWPA